MFVGDTYIAGPPTTAEEVHDAEDAPSTPDIPIVLTNTATYFHPPIVSRQNLNDRVRRTLRRKHFVLTIL